MSRATHELSHWAEYDYIVINHDIDEAFAEVQSILKAERLKRERRTGLTTFVRRVAAAIGEIARAVSVGRASWPAAPSISSILSFGSSAVRNSRGNVVSLPMRARASRSIGGDRTIDTGSIPRSPADRSANRAPTGPSRFPNLKTALPIRPASANAPSNDEQQRLESSRAVFQAMSPRRRAVAAAAAADGVASGIGWCGGTPNWPRPVPDRSRSSAADCSGQREATTDRCVSAAGVAIVASAAIAGASPSLRFGGSMARLRGQFGVGVRDRTLRRWFLQSAKPASPTATEFAAAVCESFSPRRRYQQ